jgi:SAM-dependent methyltransferase
LKFRSLEHGSTRTARQKSTLEISSMSEPEAIFRFYEGLPQQGPGSDACTREALRRLRSLPPAPRVLDLGCGAGRQTMVLAEVLQTKVIAVDRHRPFLDQLQATAERRGLGALIEVVCGDMAALELPAGSIDLLWSEGAIYLLGFEDGLRLWRPWLAPGGLAAVTECAWLEEMRPEEVTTFWREAYPAMGSVADNLARAERAGFEVYDWFTLPPSAWWDDYYTPLLRRIEELAAAADSAQAAVIAETEQEIDFYRRHHEVYGYVFYLMRARA